MQPTFLFMQDRDCYFYFTDQDWINKFYVMNFKIYFHFLVRIVVQSNWLGISRNKEPFKQTDAQSIFPDMLFVAELLVSSYPHTVPYQKILHFSCLYLAVMQHIFMLVIINFDLMLKIRSIVRKIFWQKGTVMMQEGNINIIMSPLFVLISDG
jgi:hypothetical protein